MQCLPQTGSNACRSAASLNCKLRKCKPKTFDKVTEDQLDALARLKYSPVQETVLSLPGKLDV